MPVSMDPSARYVGSNSFTQRVVMRGKLTDRRIAQLRKSGYYDPDAVKGRSEYRKRKWQRKGSFIDMGDGRLIYSP